METGLSKYKKAGVDVLNAVTDSNLTQFLRNKVSVAVLAALASGCTLDRQGTGVFPAGYGDAGTEADASEWPETSNVEAGGAAGSGGEAGAGGNDAGVDADATPDVVEDVTDEEVGTDAPVDVVEDVDAEIDAPVDSPVESGPDGGPTTCIGAYDATNTGPSQVVFNAALGACSKAYLIENGTIIQGSDTTSCESGTLLLTGVMAGQTAALFTKTWQYSTQPAVLDVEVSLPVTALSISCLEENIPTYETIGHADALDAVNNLTYVNGYCTGSETDPMIKTSNVDCPEPYMTAVILELNQQ